MVKGEQDDASEAASPRQKKRKQSSRLTGGVLRKRTASLSIAPAGSPLWSEHWAGESLAPSAGEVGVVGVPLQHAILGLGGSWHASIG